MLVAMIVGVAVLAVVFDVPLLKRLLLILLIPLAILLFLSAAGVI